MKSFDQKTCWPERAVRARQNDPCLTWMGLAGGLAAWQKIGSWFLAGHDSAPSDHCRRARMELPLRQDCSYLLYIYDKNVLIGRKVGETEPAVAPKFTKSRAASAPGPRFKLPQAYFLLMFGIWKLTSVNWN
jgi:hypothetical protein